MKDLKKLQPFKQADIAEAKALYFIPHPKIHGDWFWVELIDHTDVGPVPDWEVAKVALWTITDHKKRKSKPRDRFLTMVEIEYIRELFWEGTDVVGQFHPCPMDVTFTVHLWARTDGAPWYPSSIEIKLPPIDEPQAAAE